MHSRCDFYSDEEYEYAVQMEIEEYREQIAYEEAFAKYCEEEYAKEQGLLKEQIEFCFYWRLKNELREL